MRLAIADPPYPGQSARHYSDHPDYDGEVDHAQLAEHLAWYDGFVLHTASTTLHLVLPLFRDVRIAAWVKPFAAFKRNVPVAYAWEPVLVRAARKPVVHRTTIPLRDWLAESITLKKGLTGVKPEKGVWWGLEMMGAMPEDTVHDLFPGTGAVARGVETWKRALRESGEETT